jgi:hypothetical protein
VVGLYLNRSEQALVLCSDEKSQCQALERTQPGLSWGQDRHETVTLFAALDCLSGKVFAHTAPILGPAANTSTECPRPANSVAACRTYVAIPPNAVSGGYS